MISPKYYPVGMNNFLACLMATRVAVIPDRTLLSYLMINMPQHTHRIAGWQNLVEAATSMQDQLFVYEGHGDDALLHPAQYKQMVGTLRGYDNYVLFVDNDPYAEAIPHKVMVKKVARLWKITFYRAEIWKDDLTVFAVIG